MTEAQQDTATTVATTGKSERPKWKAPELTPDRDTGLTNIPQELMDGPSKGRSLGLHATALTEALKKVTQERDEQYARAQRLQQELERLEEQLKTSRGVNRQHQARNSALDAGLNFVRDLMRLLGVGEFSHQWYNGTLTLRWIYGGLVYTAELRPSQSQIGEFEDATFNVASDEEAEICITLQDLDLDDEGRLNNTAASAIQSAIANSDPATFRRNLTELPAAVFTTTYDDRHHGLMQLVRAAGAEGSHDLVEALLRCYALPLGLMEAALGRAKHTRTQ